MKKSVVMVLSAALAAGMAFSPAVNASAAAAATVTASAQATSEITGLPVSPAIAAQRPVAVMIDNDTRALPHYGLAEADVVYEMMNSTLNNR